MTNEQIKNLLISLVVVGATVSTAFCLFKAYKYTKDNDQGRVTEDDIKAAIARGKESVPELPDDPEDAETSSEGLVGASSEDITPEGMDLEFERDVAETETSLKELSILRYPENSTEAMEQFKQMEMAELTNEHTREILNRLFDFPFHTTDEQDDSIVQRVMDHRADFFGEDSIWVEKCTMADVILEVARMGADDLARPVEGLIVQIVQNLQLNVETPDNVIQDEVNDIIQHDYMATDGAGRMRYGILGLSPRILTEQRESIMQQYYDWTSYMVEDDDPDQDEDLPL